MIRSQIVFSIVLMMFWFPFSGPVSYWNILAMCAFLDSGCNSLPGASKIQRKLYVLFHLCSILVASAWEVFRKYYMYPKRVDWNVVESMERILQ